MKATLRIPTREQYAYIELELEGKSPKEVIEMYLDYTSLYKEMSKDKVPFETESKPANTVSGPTREDYLNK